MKVKTIKALLAVTGVVFAAPDSAHAGIMNGCAGGATPPCMDYITYGTYDAMNLSLTRTAQIFSDTNYLGLFGAIAVMAFIVAGIQTVFQKSLGRFQGNPLSAFVPILAGIVIYHGMIVPKGSLVLIDPVKNKFNIVAGIPAGVVFIMGTLNKIEDGIKNIIETNGDPTGIDRQAGGVGLEWMLYRGDHRVLLADAYLGASLYDYTQNCLFFEMARSGTTINANDFNSATDFVPLYGQAASPSNTFTYYDAANKGGIERTCAAGWNDIRSKITDPTTYTKNINNDCAKIGFDPSVPEELQNCKETMGGIVQWLSGTAYGLTNVYQQIVLADYWRQVYTSGNSALITEQASSQAIGVGGVSQLMSHEWVSVFQGIMPAVMVSIIPFLVLFIPTGLFSTIITMITGMFALIVAWRICDLITFKLAMVYTQIVANEIRTLGLGIEAINSFATVGMKGLAAFGYLNSASMMLATIIIGILIPKFSSSAMAHFSDRFGARKDSAAAQEGAAGYDPNARAQKAMGYRDSAGNLGRAGEGGLGDAFNRYSEGGARGFAENKAIGDTLGMYGQGGMREGYSGSKLNTMAQEVTAGTNNLAREIQAQYGVSFQEAHAIAQQAKVGGEVGGINAAEQLAEKRVGMEADNLGLKDGAKKEYMKEHMAGAWGQAMKDLGVHAPLQTAVSRFQQDNVKRETGDKSQFDTAARMAGARVSYAVGSNRDGAMGMREMVFDKDGHVLGATQTMRYDYNALENLKHHLNPQLHKEQIAGINDIQTKMKTGGDNFAILHATEGAKGELGAMRIEYGGQVVATDTFTDDKSHKIKRGLEMDDKTALTSMANNDGAMASVLYSAHASGDNGTRLVALNAGADALSKLWDEKYKTSGKSKFAMGIAGGVQGDLKWSSDKQAGGWVVEKATGASAEVDAYVKGAMESTNMQEASFDRQNNIHRGMLSHLDSIAWEKSAYKGEDGKIHHDAKIYQDQFGQAAQHYTNMQEAIANGKNYNDGGFFKNGGWQIEGEYNRLTNTENQNMLQKLLDRSDMPESVREQLQDRLKDYSGGGAPHVNPMPYRG